MIQITASEFRRRCMDLLETLGPEGLVIVKHNRPVARLIPLESDKHALIGCTVGNLRLADDVVSVTATARRRSN